jgi:hypothetical protein
MDEALLRHPTIRFSLPGSNRRPDRHFGDQSLGLLVVPFDQVSHFFMIRIDPIDHLAIFVLN